MVRVAYGAHQVDLLDETEVPSLAEFVDTGVSEGEADGSDRSCTARTSETV